MTEQNLWPKSIWGKNYALSRGFCRVFKKLKGEQNYPIIKTIFLKRSHF